MRGIKYIIIALIFLLAIMATYSYLYKFGDQKSASAATLTKTITSKDEWQSQTYNNNVVDTETSPGDVKLLQGKDGYRSGYASFCNGSGEGTYSNILNSWDSLYFQFPIEVENFPADVTSARIKLYMTHGFWAGGTPPDPRYVPYALNSITSQWVENPMTCPPATGSQFHTDTLDMLNFYECYGQEDGMPEEGGCMADFFPNTYYSFELGGGTPEEVSNTWAGYGFRLSATHLDGFHFNMREQSLEYPPVLEINFANNETWEVHLPVLTGAQSGTVTSSSTQIDGGADFNAWTTFTPSATIPANTSVSFRFRTSPDGTNWSSWSASASYAASIDISGLDNYRYLQVESTLANTDGLSTPILHAYTANYECTNTCDDFDHLDISPTSVTIDSGESTTITATPKDAADQEIEGITVSYSADCGSVNGSGVFTAPAVSEITVCTVTATSDCGGEVTSTITINPPDEPEPPGGCNNNGIQDNGETGVDCGGGGCADCPPPSPPGGCNNNGIQDNGETGVDCGGGGCPACPITPDPPGPEPPTPPGGCTNFSHLVISPSSLSVCANDSAIITYYGVDTSGNVMSDLSEFLVVETGTLVGNRYTAPSQPGVYSMAASSICGNANGTITVRSCLPSPPPSPPPGPPPPPCVGDDCHCEDDICWCLGEDCTCSDPDHCLPCVGEDCACDPDTMVCHCEGDECVCNDPERCEEEPKPEPKKPLPICIGPYCIDIDPKVIEVAGSVSTAALGITALVASLLLLMQGLVNVLTMIRPSQIWAYLLKGRDKKRAKGLVYDVSSGIGIPLAKVLLFRSRDQKLIRVVTTGSDGRFALETPPGEEYFIQVKKEGYDALTSTQGKLFDSTLTYENNYFGGEFRADDTTLLFNQVIPMSPNEDSVRLALGSRTLETVTKVLRVLNIPLLIFGFMMSTLAMIESKTPYNLVIFYLYLLIFAYYLIKFFIIDGRSFGLVINQAKRETVDLAIVRAISETRGKLAKTTVTNEKGRYTLVLPKGFYKIIVSKPGLKQKGNLSVRVKSNLRPRTEKIEMIEVRVKTNSSIEYGNSKQTLDSNNLRPTLVTPPITPGVQPLTSNPTRSFSDSGEIVEKYSGEIKEIGKNQSTAEQSDEKPDHDIPNWKFT